MNGTGTGTFYEQLGKVAGVFDQWGACERTVVAVALARRVPWPGLRLLQRAVDAALRLHAHADDERLERDANDETLLATLLSFRQDDDDDVCSCLRQLVALVPWLRVESERAKDVLVGAAPALVQCVVESRRAASPAPDLARQLLSYLLVHPALTTHDQRTLTQWLRYLENHMTGNRTTETVWQQRIEPGLLPDNIWSSSTSTFRRTIGKNVEFRGIVDPADSSLAELQESFSKNGRDVEISLEGEKLNFDAAIAQPKSQRSNSLTPPTTNFMQMSSSAENLTDEPFVQKPRSFSLSSEHSLSQIRPISVMYGTTGSETRLDDLRTNNCGEHPGMSTVAQWLKSLRLHKYVWLFTNISYEQMMAMDEKYLEKLGVTKGARHKILVSIKKLNEREAVVGSVTAELAAIAAGGGAGAAGAGAVGVGGAVGRALERLRSVLLTPLPPHSTLPAHIVHALDLASKCLMGGPPAVARDPSGAGGGAGAVADDAEQNVEPLSLHCWLIERALHHEAFARSDLVAALRRLRHRLPPRQFFSHVCDTPLARHYNKHKWRGASNGHGWQRPAAGTHGPANGPAHGPAVPRGKSHSYPPFPGGLPPPPPPPLDYSSLDALCLQMTEQAIN